MGRKFVFSDLVADEVRRVLAEQQAVSAPVRGGGGGGLLDGLSLQDITKFLSELSKFRAAMADMQGAAPQVSPEPVLPAANPAPPSSPPQKPARPEPTAVYESVLGAIDQLISVAGDMPLSEVRKYMIENKGEVIRMIGEALK